MSNESTRDVPDTSPSPANIGSEDVVAYLQTAGDILPDTLREAAFGPGDNDPASLLVESAEAVTTFGGINGHPRSADARQWIRTRLTDIAKRHENGFAPPPQ
jgi:hypothetical protein